jgi:hypothetical protein
MIKKPFALSPSIPQESLIEACYELVEWREYGSTVRQARTASFYCALAIPQWCRYFYKLVSRAILPRLQPVDSFLCFHRCH